MCVDPLGITGWTELLVKSNQARTYTRAAQPEGKQHHHAARDVEIVWA